ncbi:DUF2264 domain-containing protein [Parvibaculum sp.]|uniref:DUF2264 domain-containing protein n=1 Tax=Parvibaculum sp. TaxID=2024848 RepID=UPI00320FFED9
MSPESPNPLAGNPLATRDDVARAALDLFRPLLPFYSPGHARVRLARSHAIFGEVPSQLEGFARPLWGIAPLAAGGYEFPYWEMIREGLANGTDPSHREYWGPPRNRDQRLVEMAAIGFALALVPEHIWIPLPEAAKRNVARWLHYINEVGIVDNNWLFFRVMVNLGLKHVGAAYSQPAVDAALTRLDSFYLGDGWYSDGARNQVDHYIAFAFHFYGLIHARLCGDPERAEIFRSRARLFAPDYRRWFAADGAALPFGRSLTYRFAPAGFWGALAFADVEALPWSEIKGVYLRHMRWWSRRDIANGHGALTIGYAYENPAMGEEYNSPQSPYWAMKAFLPLALPATHPFWATEEAPPSLHAASAQRHPGMVIVEDSAHVVALSGGQTAPLHRSAAAKYGKFAYSSRFGFSVSPATSNGSGILPDNMLALALADQPGQFAIRRDARVVAIEPGLVHSIWQPWKSAKSARLGDVTIETWLIATDLPWLLRIHRINSPVPLISREGGFSIDRTGGEAPPQASAWQTLVRSRAGLSGIRDLQGERRGGIGVPAQQTSLVWPQTLLPLLEGRHAPGRFTLATAVFISADAGAEPRWNEAPALPEGPWFDR